MTKNNKNLLIKLKSTQKLNRLNESVESGADKKYIFEGVFTACSTPEHIIVNRNNRVYPEKVMLPWVQVLRENLKRDNFMILGEMDHPESRFETRLSEAAIAVKNIWYNFDTHCVMGRIEILDTPKGLIARKLSESYPVYVSSRAMGSVNPKTKEVIIDSLITYDLVACPGFEEARLERVMESDSSNTLGENEKKYLTESINYYKNAEEETKQKYGIICEGLTICESDSEIPKNSICDINKVMLTEEDLKALAFPLNESEDKEEKTEESTFTLPQADLNPATVDEGDKSQDDENASDDSKSSDEKKEDKKDEKKDEKKTLTDEEKAEKRAKILGIEAVDSESSSSDEEKEANRAKILDVEVGEENTDSKTEDKSDKEAEELADILDDEDIESTEEKCKSTEKCCKSADEDSLTDPKNPTKPDTGNSIPNEIKTKEKEATAKEVAAKSLNDKAAAEDVESQTKKDMDKIAELLKRAKKVKDVKESICQAYPFAISLSDENFAKFAALKPASKNKVQKFIMEHDIYDVASINELWATPLLEERRLMKNWLRLASEEDKRLFTEAPMDVQDAIEESAKYVMIRTKEDADKFWERTGLRQRNASKMINESMVQRYGIQTSENVEKTSVTAEVAANLGYSADYFKMLEDMY